MIKSYHFLKIPFVVFCLFRNSPLAFYRCFFRFFLKLDKKYLAPKGTLFFWLFQKRRHCQLSRTSASLFACVAWQRMCRHCRGVTYKGPHAPPPLNPPTSISIAPGVVWLACAESLRSLTPHIYLSKSQGIYAAGTIFARSLFLALDLYNTAFRRDLADMCNWGHFFAWLLLSRWISWLTAALSDLKMALPDLTSPTPG